MFAGAEEQAGLLSPSSKLKIYVGSSSSPYPATRAGGTGSQAEEVVSVNFGELYWEERISCRTITIENRSDKDVPVAIATSVDSGAMPISVSIHAVAKEQDDQFISNSELLAQMESDRIAVVPGSSTCSLIVSLLPSVPSMERQSSAQDMAEQLGSFMAVTGEVRLSYVEPATNQAAATSVPFVAHYCRSMMRLDQQEIEFEDCLPGNSYVRDFSVWNRSEIGLWMKITPLTSSSTAPLEFSQYDTTHKLPLRQELRIPAFSHLSVRITFKPSSLGETEQVYLIENIHNPYNIVKLVVRTTVRSGARDEMLLVEAHNGAKLGSGHVLQFGDCYNGMTTSQLIWLQNASSAVMEIKLASDHPKEVSFELSFDQNTFAPAGALPSANTPPSRLAMTKYRQFLSAQQPRMDFTKERPDEDSGRDHDDDDEDDEEDDDEEEEDDGDEEDNEAGKEADDEGQHEQTEDTVTAMSPDASTPFQGRTGNSKDADAPASSFQRNSQPIQRDGVVGRRPEPASSNITLQTPNDGDDWSDNSDTEQRYFVQPRPSPVRRADKPNSRAQQPVTTTTPSEPSTKQRGSKTPDGQRLTNRIGDLMLEPGARRAVLVTFSPTMHSTDVLAGSQVGEDWRVASAICASNEGQLRGRTLRLSLLCRMLPQPLHAANDSTHFDGSAHPLQSLTGAEAVSVSNQFTAAIVCKAQTCSSLISVQPASINLGDCNVGEFKTTSIEIRNLSDLPTVVVPHVVSKTLGLSENELHLASREVKRLKIEYVARELDKNYHKKITFMNAMNSHDHKEVEVRATNVDAHQVLFHSVFYKIMVQNTKRQLQVFFDKCVFNCPNLRTFTIRNIHNNYLTLDMRPTEPDLMTLYKVGASQSKKSSAKPNSTEAPSTSSREQWIEDMKWGSPLKALVDAKPSRTASMANDLPSIHTLRGMDLAVDLPPVAESQQDSPTAQRSNTVDRSSPALAMLESKEAILSGRRSSKHRQEGATSIERLRKLLDSSIYPYPANNKAISKAAKESKAVDPADHVRAVQSALRELEQALNDRYLEPLSMQGNTVFIPKGAEVTIAVILHPKPQTKPEELKRSTMMSHINITLLNVDTSNVPLNMLRASPQFSESAGKLHSRAKLKPRGLLVRAMVCRSEIALVQKNINFGKMTTGETATRTVTITNRSSVPALYSVIKSGSISSGFLRLPAGRKGVVPALGSHSVQFVFKPSLPGPFEETLEIANILDSTNNQVVTIKARVLKPETFAIAPISQWQLPADAVAAENIPADTMLADPEPKITPLAASADSISLLYLGDCIVGEYSNAVLAFTVRNVTPRRREFIIDASHPSVLALAFDQLSTLSADEQMASTSSPFEPIPEIISNVCLPKFRFTLEQSSSGLGSDERAKLEEKLEHYEHKLRVAERKGKTEKISKLLKKIENVKSMLLGNNGVDKSQLEVDVDSASDSESETDEPRQRRTTSAQAAVKADDEANVFHFSLDADSTCTITARVSILPGPAFRTWPGALPFTGFLRLFECRKEDVVKEIRFAARIFSSRRPYLEHTLSRQDVAQDDSQRGLLRVLADASETGRPFSPEPVSEAERHSYERGGSVDCNFLVVIPAWCALPSRDIIANYKDAKQALVGWSMKLIQNPERTILEGSFSVHSVTAEDLSIRVTFQPDIEVEVDVVMTHYADWQNNRVRIYPEDVDPAAENSPTTDSPKQAAFYNIAAGTSRLFHVKWSVPANFPPHDRLFLGFVTVEAEGSPPTKRSIPVMLSLRSPTAIQVDSHVQLGECTVAASKSFNLSVMNISDRDLHYIAMITTKSMTLRMKGQQTGVVPPNEEVQIPLEFVGTSSGKAVSELVIRNLNNRFDQKMVTVSATVIAQKSLFVHFPDLDPPATGSLRPLELGNLYMTHPSSPQYGQVSRRQYLLRIKNISGRILYVTAVSNLKRQCYVFADEGLNTPLVGYALAPGIVHSIYVVVEPFLPREWYDSGQVRNFVGGIRFLFYSAKRAQEGHATATEGANGPLQLAEEVDPLQVDQSRKLFECSVKFQGRVGCSLLQVHAEDINIRCVPLTNQPFRLLRGRFVLESITDELPLEYEYEGQLCRMHVGSVMLRSFYKMQKCAFIVLEAHRNILQPHAKRTVEFLIVYERYSGLIQHTLRLRNLSSGRVHNVVFSVFAEPGVLAIDRPWRLRPSVFSLQFGVVATPLRPVEFPASLWLAAPAQPLPLDPMAELATELPTLQSLLHTAPFKTFDLNNTSEELQPYKVVGASQHRLGVIHLTNQSAEAVTVVPYSNLPILARFTLIGGANLVHRNAKRRPLPYTQNGAPLAACGDSVTLQSLQTVRVEVLVRLEAFTKPLPVRQAEDGKLLDLDGTILFVRDSFRAANRQRLHTWNAATDTRPTNVQVAIESCLQLLNIRTSCLKPLMKLSTRPVDLGVVGAVNNWAEKQFEVQLEGANITDIPFRIEELPVWLELRQDIDTSELVLPRQRACTLHFVAKITSQMVTRQSKQMMEASIRIVNDANPSDVATVTVSVVVVPEALRMTDSSGDELPEHLEVRALTMPPLVVPRLNEPMRKLKSGNSVSLESVAWFTITNVLEDDVTITTNVQENDSLHDGVELAVLSKQTFAPFQTQVLRAGDNIDLQIVAKGISGATIQKLPFAERQAQSSNGFANQPLTPNQRIFDNIALGELRLNVVGRTYDDNDNAKEDLHFSQRIELSSSVILESTTLASTQEMEFAFRTASTSRHQEVQLIETQQQRMSIRNPQNREVRFRVETSASRVASNRMLLGADGSSSQQDVASEGVLTDTITAIVSPSNGVIPANSSLELLVTLAPGTLPSNTSEMRAPDDDYPAANTSFPVIRVYDSDAPLHPAEEIVVKVVQQEAFNSRTALPRTSDLSPQSAPSFVLQPSSSRIDATGLLRLRGCTPSSTAHGQSGYRYEINLGQQIRHDGSLEWEITIENISTKRAVEYRIYPLSKTEGNWLQLGRDRGTLEPGSAHRVNIYCDRSQVGLYSTYLVVENGTALGDLHLIRTRMEVVEHPKSRQVRPDAWFKVHVAGDLWFARNQIPGSGIALERQATFDDSSQPMVARRHFLDYRDIYANKVYHRRSLVLENCSDMPLEFQLSSTLPANELSFSLSTTSLKRLSSISLDAHSQAQLFLYFRPRYTNAQGDGEPCLIEGEVSVTCRLIKDYHETVQIRARCFPPRFHVAIGSIDAEGDTMYGESHGLVFTATALRRATSGSRLDETKDSDTRSVLTLESTSSSVTLTNLASHRISCVVCNDTMFFACGLTEDECDRDHDPPLTRVTLDIEPGESKDLVVKPRRHLLEDPNKFVHPEGKYIHEHITIYNRDAPTEKCRLALRLSFSDAGKLYITPNKAGYPFMSLEETIAAFLSKFKTFWAELVIQDDQLSTLFLQLGASACSPTLKPVNFFEKAPTTTGSFTSETAIAAAFGLDNIASVRMAMKSLESLLNSFASVRMGELTVCPQRSQQIGETVIPDARFAEIAQRLQSLSFDLFYITDELVFYALTHEGHVGRFALDLAQLLYSLVFRHPVFTSFVLWAHYQQAVDEDEPNSPDSARRQGASQFPAVLVQWVKQLTHFLNFFPTPGVHLNLLWDIFQFLQICVPPLPSTLPALLQTDHK